MKSILKGLEALQAVSEKDIDAAISWLEEALAAYKTLRAVQSVMQRRPKTLELPEWESAVDMDRKVEQPQHVVHSKPAVARLLEFLLTKPHGATHKEIYEATGIARSNISVVVKNCYDSVVIVRRGKAGSNVPSITAHKQHEQTARYHNEYPEEETQ